MDVIDGAWEFTGEIQAAASLLYQNMVFRRDAESFAVTLF